MAWLEGHCALRARPGKQRGSLLVKRGEVLSASSEDSDDGLGNPGMGRETPEPPVLGYLTVQLSTHIPTLKIHTHSFCIYFLTRNMYEAAF